MGITDGIVLGILAVSALWGFLAGAKKRVTKLIAFIGATTLAVLFYSMLANLIAAQTPMGVNFAAYFSDLILGKAEGNAQALQLLNTPYQDILATGQSDALLTQAFNQAGIPSFFASYFITKIFITDGTLALAVGSSFAAAVIYAAAFVVIFAVSYIVIKLLSKFVLGAGSPEGKGLADRLAGLLFSVLIGSAFILVAMMIVIGISYAAPSLRELLETDLGIIGANAGRFSIGRVFYNWGWQIINAFVLPFLSVIGLS